MDGKKGTKDRDLNISAQVFASDQISTEIIRRFPPYTFHDIFLDNLAEMLYNAYVAGYEYKEHNV